MTLNDTDILELNELCNALLDNTIAEPQHARLAHWLKTSEDARQFYVRTTGLSASLCHYASELQTEAPDAPASHMQIGRRWRWVIGLLSIAAAIAVVVWLGKPKPQIPVAKEPTANENEFVAQLTGSKETQWGNASGVQPSGRFLRGEQIELTKGFAEITFDSGARVLLQGPASMELTSAWSAKLNRGTLKASVPPEAIGFTISNPTVEVVDLGTEFTMFADAGGTATDVMVLKGKVEAAPRTSTDPQPILLREKESRRFAASGVSNVDGEERFDELTQAVDLDRYEAPFGYAHWSFDETEGAAFKAVTSGLPFNAPAARLDSTPSAASGIHAKGRFESALRFDGSRYATTAFPGMSEHASHTIVFWLKIPKEANLQSAYAMVAWGAINRNFGSHPFQICWNREAKDGPFGVLRTDYSRGYAIGTTPLRDGRWHHIAVVFIPRDDPARPVEVKQYVDGRLEGEGRPDAPGSEIFMSTTKSSATNGMIWLGCRLGPKGVRTERFFGDMDELFIADRALSPGEIVSLMSQNQVVE